MVIDEDFENNIIRKIKLKSKIQYTDPLLKSSNLLPPQDNANEMKIKELEKIK